MTHLKPLSEQVMVITGGSSGIGLATAKLAARSGAKVILAARTREALAEAVDQINAESGPGSASFVVADVGRRSEVERVAEAAMQRHGRIDTWINDAGVLLFGKLQDLAEEDMRRLFDTNFWGVVHGSLVAARLMRQGGGAIINVGSVESDRSVPLQGIYAASKHAVKAFTEALRTELEREEAPISVTLVKPGSIGSPIAQHSKSMLGLEPQLPPPIYQPEEAARTIVHAAEHHVRTAYVGGFARFVGAAAAVAPRLVDWVTETFLVSGQVSDRPAVHKDNVSDGASEARVHGDHGGALVRPSLYSAAARHPLASAALAGGLIAAGAFLLARRGSEPLAEEPAWDEDHNIPVEGV